MNLVYFLSFLQIIADLTRLLCLPIYFFKLIFKIYRILSFIYLNQGFTIYRYIYIKLIEYSNLCAIWQHPQYPKYFACPPFTLCSPSSSIENPILWSVSFCATNQETIHCQLGAQPSRHSVSQSTHKSHEICDSPTVCVCQCVCL